MMTSLWRDDVINDDEIFLKVVNQYFAHTGKISSRLDKYFKSYQKFLFRGGGLEAPTKMHEGLIQHLTTLREKFHLSKKRGKSVVYNKQIHGRTEKDI